MMPDLTYSEWVLTLIAAFLGVIAMLTAYGVLSLQVAQGATDPHPILRFLHREPAMLTGAVGAAATVLAAFGFGLDGVQIGALSSFFTIVVAILVRQVVTSPETIQRSGLTYDRASGTLKPVVEDD